MRQYKNIITLVKNSRGVYDLDTIKGCYYGMKTNINGCYNSCYAARLAKSRGFDFSKSVKRYFKNKLHLYIIIKNLKNIDMPFVRIGVSGDPSEDWEHTINICEKINYYNFFGLLIRYNFTKPIVVITKHWHIIPNTLLKKISKMNICINTSISALDSPQQIKHRLNQYERLKDYCKSVLRVNTCNFNINNLEGLNLSKIQNSLLKNDNVLDTILRFSKNHELVTAGIVKLNYTQYLKSKVYASVFNTYTYFGECGKCPEMCGINL